MLTKLRAGASKSGRELWLCLDESRGVGGAVHVNVLMPLKRINVVWAASDSRTAATALQKTGTILPFNSANGEQTAYDYKA